MATGVNPKSVLLVTGRGNKALHQIIHLSRRQMAKNARGFAIEFLDVDSRIQKPIDIEDEVARTLMHRQYGIVMVPTDAQLVDAVRAQHLGPLIGYGTGVSYNPPLETRYTGLVDTINALEERPPLLPQLDALLSEQPA